ncbi:hypothetical protein [Amycolatopsis sp. TNS106]|uniref:hypothetical protein n=1 Tax=Amycolatopsis sp. TNS106 TaxID=2861750 RepID=UPI001C589A98|nr:hypothetical protein [Amycolatopsis sp. TNS106]QXV62314.1 hypothetical protein CVV72_38540 [Amycolatopsis sp. TNS106]
MGGLLGGLFGYSTLGLKEQHQKITAELPHIKGLHAAADMWDEAATWIADKAVAFHQQVENLVSNWPDGAGAAFGAVAKQDIDTLRSWVQTPDAQIPVTNGFTLPMLPSTVQSPLSRPSHGITMSNVANRLRALADDIKRTFDYVDTLYRDYHALFDNRPGVQAEDRKAVENDYRVKAGLALDNLARHYRDVSDNALPDARGLAWTGPRSDVVPTVKSDSPATDPGGGGNPSSTGGDPGAANPGETQEPNPADTPETPEEQKPLTLQEQLDLASSGLDVASKAVDLGGKVAEQLLGSGGAGSVDVPDPATVPNPLEGWKPGESPSLSGLSSPDNPLGLPTLAGLGDGGGGIGGGPGAGGIGSGGGVSPMPGTASPAAGVAGFGAAVPGTSAAAGSAGGTAGLGGSPGMMPMYPQNGAGGRAGGGDIRPGAAEHVNAVRSRKPEGEPGVALRGRAGAAPRPPVTRQRPAVENDVVHVLDEDLWQLDPATDQPKYRTRY